MKVLIAEDDRVLARLLEDRLLDQGADTLVVFDALQAVLQGLRFGPDVILLDVNMPGGTGLEVLKRFKGTSKTRRAPVIAFSSTPHPNLAEELKMLGATEFLPKPFTFEQLYSVIEKVTQRKSASAPMGVPALTTLEGR